VVAAPSSIVYDFGNVTEGSDFTFVFAATQKAAATFFPAGAELAGPVAPGGAPTFEKDKGQGKSMQIQCRIEHTFPSGIRCLRVLTARLPVTADRDAVEAAMRSSIVAEHAVHESAALAQRGDYQRARVNLISTQRLLQRGMKSRKQQRGYLNFIVQGERLDGFMREAAAQEAVLKLTGVAGAAAQRKTGRDDTAAKNIVQMKTVALSAFEQ